jgi:GNAT superfamily N-acetyltransferase
VPAREPSGVGGGRAEVPIRPAEGALDIAQARALFEEYAAWLGENLCFQGFADELATLPGAYAPPRGRLLLAGPPGDACGCVALRPLAEHTAEIKRLYVQPRARGTGTGLALARAVIAQSEAAGYRTLKLDTLARMTEARALYARLGFVECAPYYRSELANTIYMERVR